MFKVNESKRNLVSYTPLRTMNRYPLLNGYFGRYQNGKAHTLLIQEAHSKNSLSYRSSQMAKIETM